MHIPQASNQKQTARPRSQHPFFGASPAQSFFAKRQIVNQTPFFQASEQMPSVQAKLTMGTAGDHCRQETNFVNPQVVEHLRIPSPKLASAQRSQFLATREVVKSSGNKQSPLIQGKFISYDLSKPKLQPTKDAVIQRKVFQVHDDGTLTDDESLIAELYAQDLDRIVNGAALLVDKQQSSTKAAAAYYRNNSSQTRMAKRGTAIHEEVRQQLGQQMQGYGDTEVKLPTGGRADIHMKFPSGKIVIYDVTSTKQAQKSHTSGRGYGGAANVARVYEISYDVDPT